MYNDYKKTVLTGANYTFYSEMNVKFLSRDARLVN